ncbi:MAG TPA: hypothetical protein VMB52_04045 [Verrucomicrobiae bacterium]|nr:hypothetical protein [Verrucomicrobiae bacterium]
MDVVVAQGKMGRSRIGEHFRKRRRVYLIALVTVMVIAAIVVALALTHHSAPNTAEQQKLQSALLNAENSTNSAEVVNDASQLITGASQGKFDISNNDLGQLHLYKAQALTSAGQNQLAIADFAAAAQLNSSIRTVALEGEIQARIGAGQTTQVIPLLQQVIAIEKKITDDPTASQMASMYQNAITEIQNHQEVSL